MVAVPDLSQPKVFVSDIADGTFLQSPFAVAQKTLREFDRGKFLTLRLADRTGKVNAVVWDNAEDVSAGFDEGDLVFVQGQVKLYRGEQQVNVKSISKIDDLSQVEVSDFLPVAPVSLEQLTAEFDERIENLRDEDLKRLLAAFRSDEALWHKFSHAPGAKRWHHAYLHGLLHHTLTVVKQCELLAPFYPRIDADLLVTGAIFHDCGKSDELTYSFSFDYSTEGRLLGHIFIGANVADRLMSAIPGFPPEKRRCLLHLILSHHGEVELSPVLPMTMEAALLHHIENLDAQLTAFDRELNKAEGGEWTGYVNLINRYLYLGEKDEAKENTKRRQENENNNGSEEDNLPF